MRLLTLLLVTIALVAAPEDDTRVWLRRLSSVSSTERALAQDWLATHLSAADYADLAEVAARSDAELRRRLLEALSADDRHLELVVLLSEEEDEGLSRLGLEAFDELLARWCPDASAPPTDRRRVLELLAPTVAEIFVLPASDELATHDLDRLARLGDLPVPLVITPEIQMRRSASRPRMEGTVSALLAGLTDADRSSFAGVGDWEGETPVATSFLFVSTRGGVRRSSGAARLASWCQRVQSTHTPSRRASAAARALATTAWPAGLRWLETRWIERRDRNALEGLLAAAERGRVAPALIPLPMRGELLKIASAALASGEEDGIEIAERIARALAVIGAVTPGGRDPAPLLVEDWESLNSSERWVRLVALEGTPSADPRVTEVLTSTLSDPRITSSALRFAALRALVRVPRGRPSGLPPARLRALLSWARAEGRLDELLSLLVACEVPPDPELLSKAGEARGARAAAIFVDWAWRAGDEERVVELLREYALKEPLVHATSSVWVQLLAGWVAREGPGPVRSIVKRVSSGLEPDERGLFAWIALLAGALPPGDQVRVFETLAALPRLGAIELELLAALVSGPRGKAAQERLLEELRQRGEAAGLADPLGLAFEAAAVNLRRARRDEQLRSLSVAVKVLVHGRGHPLHERLSAPHWPPAVMPTPTRLDHLDRRLPRDL